MKKLFIFLGMILSAQLAFGETPNFSALENAELGYINQYAEKLVASMQQKSSPDFGYDQQSVLLLSDLITKESSTYSEQTKQILPGIYGSYLGIAILKKYGGKWVNVKGVGYGVMIDENTIKFPFDEVLEHIEKGNAESIYAFYMSADKPKNAQQLTAQPK